MTTSHTILVVDDEARIRRVLESSLVQQGYEVIAAESAEAAAVALNSAIDLVLTDLKMPGGSGLDVIDAVNRDLPGVPVVVMTAYGTIDVAVEAMQRGAMDFVTKPFDLDALDLVLRRALDAGRIAREHRYLREHDSVRVQDMIGRSESMQRLFKELARVAPAPSNVIVTGETGTGKELVARALHDLSPRRDRLFVPVNCAAIPDDLLESELFGHSKGAFTGAVADHTGKFELAHGGTLFLDEIGDMNLTLQAKMLRVLEDRIVQRLGTNREVRVDVRIVAATHQDIEEAVRAGRFRSDLYYRLNVVRVELPPLRERRDDIPLLAAHFFSLAAARTGFAVGELRPRAVAALVEYDWPGNVRELSNICERLTVLSDGNAIDGDAVARMLNIDVAILGEHTEDADDAPIPSLQQALDRAEREVISLALAESGDNKAKAARLLKISERSLWYKIKRHAGEAE